MEDRKLAEKKKLAAYSTVGMMFPASIAVGAGFGYLLDRWLNTAPYMIIIFTLYGIGAGFYNLFKIVHLDGKKKK